MLFNSIEFFIFFFLVFIIYWFVLKQKTKFQNVFLILVSYIFYGWWDWRFLGLIVLSSVVDFILGLKLESTDDPKRRRLFLYTSIFVNIGILVIFKYFNFFSDSFHDLFQLIGYNVGALTLNVILPVGISFYTFQTMSYTIDIFNNKLKAAKDPFVFFAYVSFFPQLVAGPIERATNLIPQFQGKRTFDYKSAVTGCQQILWGFFKKVVIADNCAVHVNAIFSDYQNLPGVILVIGAVLFAFQIYGDFSGYSDIAIGTAKLLGFNLMTNFRMPYFSRDIAEFWRKWHISLSTWFRDYLYIPLGGSRNKRIRNVFIIFLVSGFWHGANWTFIIWGFLNALFFLPLLLSKKNRVNTGDIASGKILPSFNTAFKILFTFSLTCFAWIFFRAENVTQAYNYILNIFSNASDFPSLAELMSFRLVFFFIFISLIIEWYNRNKEFGLDLSRIKSKAFKIGVYYTLILFVLRYAGQQQGFIYFQF